METEQEKMQFLGFCGVYKESYKVIFSWRKIFSQMTFTLILPLSFIFLYHIQVCDLLLGKIANDSVDEIFSPRGTPQHQKLEDVVTSDQIILFLFKLVYFTFLLILSLFSTAAVVYTVASFYTGKEVTFSKVMSVVPNVWKRLVVTFLCNAVAFFVYNVMATALVALVWLLTLTIGITSGAAAVLMVITILYICGLVYLAAVWQLANVVTVLEDSYGFEAMAKSKELIKGKMGLSVMITLKLTVLYFLISLLFSMVVVEGWKLFGLGSIDRTAFGMLSFLLLSHFYLFQLVIHAVLYFVCKSYHHEIVDKSTLSDRLQVYDCYQPLNTKHVHLDYHV